jgi:hypothetical protein
MRRTTARPLSLVGPAPDRLPLVELDPLADRSVRDPILTTDCEESELLGFHQECLQVWTRNLATFGSGNTERA